MSTGTITELTFSDVTSNYGFVDDKIMGSYEAVTFSLKKESPVAVIYGNNGVGKTSLLKTLINKGVVNIEGNFTMNFSNKNLNKTGQVRKFHREKIKTLYIPQGIIDMFPKENCVSTVVGSWAQIGRVKDYRKILDDVGLLADFEEMKSVHCGKISLGQAHVLSLIITSVYQPDLLLVDEPTASASQQNKNRIISFLQAFVRAGKLLVIVTHDEEMKKIVKDRLTATATDLAGTFVEIKRKK